jgi:hypothetical protein
MLARIILSLCVCLSVGAQALGQTAPAGSQGSGSLVWGATGDNAGRTAKGDIVRTAATSATTSPPPATAAVATSATPGSSTAGTLGSLQPVVGKPAADAPRRPIAQVSSGNGTLPNEKGQIWREYDISPYTTRVTSTERPEQAVVDWILRETGYETWHGEPLGILSATRKTLRVYHTPEVQAAVADLVDRFVGSGAETGAFGMRVITLDHPNWRAKSQKLLHPMAVQTPGVSAWVLEKEDAAVLIADLQRRSDFREHSSSHLLVNNGQATVVSATRSRPYVRDLLPRGDASAAYDTVMGKVEEGFLLDFSPLLSVDRKLIDANVRCEINQVERMVPVVLDAPTPAAPRQRATLEVPQLTEYRFQERFRWPVDKVLLLSMGMVAMPVPIDGKTTGAGIPLLSSSPPRADLLVLFECKGQNRDAARAPARPATDGNAKNNGRY